MAGPSGIWVLVFLASFQRSDLGFGVWYTVLTLMSEDDADGDTRAISVNPLKGRFPV